MGSYNRADNYWISTFICHTCADMDNISKATEPINNGNNDLISEETSMEEMERKETDLNSDSDVSDCDSQSAENVVESTSQQEERSDEGLMMVEESETIILQSFGHSGDEVITDVSDDNFAGKLIQDLDMARKNGSFCDITLLIGQEKHPIKAHRVVLSSASDYFRAMFATDLKEGSQSEVNLPKTDVSTMELLMEFAYTGKLGVTNKNIEKIMKAANFFGMGQLLERCVDILKPRINKHNAVEILEFAEHISNDVLKQCAKQYFIENFEVISKKNLDVMDMSHDLLLEIIEDDATVIDPDPTENEERLFQLGWNNLQTKSDDIWEASILKLMKAVHLPLVSDSFLCDLTRKIEDHPEAMKLAEKAKLQKKTGLHSETQVSIEETVRWGMERFQKFGRAFVKCDNMINQTTELEWHGPPVFVDGKSWALKAKIETHTDEGPPVKYLSCYLCPGNNLHTGPIKCTFKFELEVPSNSFVSFIPQEASRVFNKKGWGIPTFMKLTDVFANYYDKDNDCCTIIAHVSNVTVVNENK